MTVGHNLKAEIEFVHLMAHEIVSKRCIMSVMKRLFLPSSPGGKQELLDERMRYNYRVCDMALGCIKFVINGRSPAGY